MSTAHTGVASLRVAVARQAILILDYQSAPNASTSARAAHRQAQIAHHVWELIE